MKQSCWLGTFLALFVGLTHAANYAFTTSAECYDIVKQERQRWNAEYDRATKCWLDTRCGNPGADSRFGSWQREISELSSRCSSFSAAERDRQMAFSTQTPDKTTVVPYSGNASNPPVRQRTMPVQPSRPANRQERNAQAIGLLGALLGAALSTGDREDEDESSEEASVQVASVAPVASFKAAKKSHEELAQISKEIFDKARKELKGSEEANAIQDFAWDRLMEQIDSANQQLIDMSKQIDLMLSKLPSDDKGHSSVKISLRSSEPLRAPRTTYDYVGRTMRGKPDGLGRIKGEHLEAFGRFSSGGDVLNGYVIERAEDATEEWDGTFHLLRPTGVIRYRYTSDTRPSSDVVGVYDAEKPVQISYKSSSGTTYRGLGFFKKGIRRDDVSGIETDAIMPHGEGELKSLRWSLLGTFVDGKLHGLGQYHDAMGFKFGVSGVLSCNFSNGNCNSAAFLRSGPVRYVGYMKNSAWIGDVVVQAPTYVYLGQVRDGKFNGLGKLVNDKGEILAGEFVNGRFSGIGQKRFPDDYVHQGKFENGELVDGIIFNPIGQQQGAVGGGGSYDVAHVTSKFGSAVRK